ncbi:MAG: GNAT family N-acetyltransferase [Nitrospiraceae bacterium]|nr:GNAT family N-acetyltransferase [Nitrospira sp.]MCA9455451.1 GNAT family N-acetyltransferase [Nitrospira sp.]MCB9775685.1 GNAT family N-acetyltransferase [Nitrospiraceae bacterium]
MAWSFKLASEAFPYHQEMWDDLNRANGNHLLLDSMFLGPLLRHFGNSHTLLGVCNDKRNPGMVLIEKTKFGFWQTFQPSQAPLGPLVLGNHEGVLDQIERLLHDLPGFALAFSVTQQDPDSTPFNVQENGKVKFLNYITTSKITLEGMFEEYWKRRGRNLRQNLAKQRRRLEEAGTKMNLLVTRDSRGVAECLREYGRLEEAGWKGISGTAVGAESQQGRFYKEVFENFCQRNEGVIYQLTLNGRVVASDLCLERGKVMIVLKTTYDETLEKFSPSFLMRYEIIKTLFEEGHIAVLEFYGRVQDWHRKWTDELRPMFHVDFYRNSWIPRVRLIIKLIHIKKC